MRPRLLLLAAVAATAIGQTMGVAADTNPQPIDFAHNVTGAPAPVTGAVFGTSPAVKTGTAICTIDNGSARTFSGNEVDRFERVTGTRQPCCVSSMTLPSKSRYRADLPQGCDFGPWMTSAPAVVARA